MWKPVEGSGTDYRDVPLNLIIYRSHVLYSRHNPKGVRWSGGGFGMRECVEWEDRVRDEADIGGGTNVGERRCAAEIANVQYNVILAAMPLVFSHLILFLAGILCVL